MAEDNGGPFGNPDGSRAAIEEIVEGFVSFGSEEVWGGLAVRAGDRRARVIVGRKGSGKTVYLRRLRADAATESSLYVDDIQQGVPQTELIVEFCQTFKPNLVTEKWVEVWNHAILSSVVSHLLCQISLRSHIPPEALTSLQEDYAAILPGGWKTPVSAYSQVTRILNTHRSYNSLTSYLNHELWPQLEWLIGDIIRGIPPMCFYIDAVDEEFEHAPMYWMQCQLGLFLATMRLLRDTRLGNRLHIYICVRDIVMAALLRSEHRTRYVDEPHIRILRWTSPAISYFLEQKVRQLKRQHFIKNSETDGRTVASWLGSPTYKNTARRVEEPMVQYLLRHTRLIPRDVITLGNRLCRAIAQYRYNPALKPWEQHIRDVVRDAARVFGEEQLEICANQMVSDGVPSGAARERYSESYTGIAEYMSSVKNDIKTIIATIGRDRFGPKELAEAKRAATTVFGGVSDLFSVLWQNGLVGYVDKRTKGKPSVFFSEDRIDEFYLPTDKDEYVFHSCVIDAVGVKAIGRRPVVVAAGI